MAMDLVPEEQSFKDSIRDANKFLINFKKDSNMVITTTSTSLLLATSVLASVVTTSSNL